METKVMVNDKIKAYSPEEEGRRYVALMKKLRTVGLTNEEKAEFDVIDGGTLESVKLRMAKAKQTGVYIVKS